MVFTMMCVLDSEYLLIFLLPIFYCFAKLHYYILFTRTDVIDTATNLCAEGDSLLCYYGPMLYEAKCLKRRKTGDSKVQYFIRYKGSNCKWEEWVDGDRVLAVNAANMNKIASLKEIHLKKERN